MRHRVAGRRLSRTSEHRLTMRRNLVASLIQHETISTTLQKAKEAKPFAEKLITLAKKGTLHSRRRAIALLGDRDIIDYEDDKPIKKSRIIRKLFSELGPRYLDRTGGYTRIIRLSLRRLGDNGQLVLLQLIGPDESPKKETKPTSKKRSRKRAKKAMKVEETIETEETTDTEEVSETEEPLQDQGLFVQKEASPGESTAETEKVSETKETLRTKESAETVDEPNKNEGEK